VLYKQRLDLIRDQQAAMIKDRKATVCPETWRIDGDRSKGERMLSDIAKLLIRSFNNECDVCVASVKFNNVDSMEKRINKAFEVLNKLGERTQLSLVPEFLNLKLQELYLSHEYAIMKQEEKEEQKEIRQREREKAIRNKEIEEEKAKLEKDERHFENALSAIMCV